MISRITDNIFQGPSLAGEMPPHEITAVINLQRHTQDRFQVNFGGNCRIRAYAWFPVPDEPDYFPGVRWLEQVVTTLRAFIDNGHRVLVHCRAGISRSSLVVAAYLVRYDGLSVAAALAKIKEARPYAEPNPAFVAGLAAYRLSLLPDTLSEAPEKTSEAAAPI